MEQEEQLVREIHKGLLNWYDFRQNSNILYIGNEKDALVEMLTGIIYEGPGLVKKTLKHLEKVKPSMDNQNS